jgi:limonene-1,2-epoxide hydrolase
VRRLVAALPERRPAVLLRALVPSTALVLALALASCGTDGEVTVSAAPDESPSIEIEGDADEADVAVIDEWARTLAAGDPDAAARLFAIPSIAQNAGPPLQISDFDDARLFNASLPCGAELVRAERAGEFTIATFVLKERPGSGTCGDGTGQTAMTAFVIEDGRIAEWRRVVEARTPAPSRAT